LAFKEQAFCKGIFHLARASQLEVGTIELSIETPDEKA
jgi:hypothetical protein